MRRPRNAKRSIRRRWSRTPKVRSFRSEVRTTPSETYPVQRMRLARFEGKQWVLFGDVIGE